MAALLVIAFLAISSGLGACCVGMPSTAEDHGCCAPSQGMRAAAPDCCRSAAGDTALTAKRADHAAAASPVAAFNPVSFAASETLRSVSLSPAGLTPRPLTILRI